MTRARVEVSSNARADLLALAHFVARNHPAAAERLFEDFDHIGRLLEQQPLLGRAWEPAPEYRRAVLDRFGILVYYRVDDGDPLVVEIVRVVHGARRPSSDDLE